MKKNDKMGRKKTPRLNVLFSGWIDISQIGRLAKF
jgi:hypothetical protein